MAILLATSGVSQTDLLFATEPLRMVAEPAFSVEGLTLLLDVVEGAPVALLQDPSVCLTPERRPVTFLATQEKTELSDLPVLRVTDVVPDFWAEPAVWRHFRGGPASFSGIGRDQQYKDWAGRPQTDQRAYALDNGFASSNAPLPSGVGRLLVVGPPESPSMMWSGAAGRIYALEFTPDLHSRFQRIRTFINLRAGVVTIPLSLEGRSGYYRVAEVTP
jgi:hypothetical protein